MSEIRRSFRALDSNIRLTSNNLKFGEKSVKNYEEGIKSLTSDIDKQKKNLEALRKQYEAKKNTLGENHRKTQELAAEYNRQADNLNRLEHQLKTATKELERMRKEQQISQSGWGKLGKTFDGIGSKLKSVSSGMRDVGRSLSRSITAPALGAASALAGITLVKGFDRLTGIDNAQAKLKGLGHDAKSVEEIMNSALESVKGTAHGMDEAATTAAGAVAAGVKPGKELTRYLTLTGDAAAIAGTSMSEMGSIINQVQTSQIAYTDNLNQLADRGIPIYQWIGEEAGVAASEVKKMASEGKISSEMFLKAIEDNIGGAAKKMGEESFTAGVANMWAAVGRLGAAFLDAGGKGGGFFSQIKPLISDFTGSLDSMGDIAEKAGVKFGEFFASVVEKIKTAKQWFDELSPTIQNVITKFAIFGTIGAVVLGPVLTFGGLFLGLVGNIMTALSPLMTGIAKSGGLLKLLASRFSFLLGPVGIVIGTITTLGTVFVTAYNKSETFRAGIDKIVNAVKTAFNNFKTLISGIKGLFKDDGQKGRDILTSLGLSENLVMTLDNIALKLSIFKNNVKSFITGIKGLFKDDGQEGRDILTSIGLPESVVMKLDNIALKLSQFRANVKTFISGVKGLFKDDGEQGRTLLSSLGITDETVAMMDEIALAISILRQNVIKGFGAIVSFFKESVKNIKSYWNENGQDILQSFQNIFTGIQKVVTPIIQGIVTVIQWAFPYVKKVIEVALKVAFEIVKQIWSNIQGIIQGALKIITGLINTFSGLFTGNWSKMWDGIQRILNGAVQVAWNFINLHFIGRILRGVGGFATSLVRSLKGGWDKAVSGIKSFVGTAKGWFDDLLNSGKKKFDDLVTAAKKLPGRIGDGIKGMASKVTDGVKSVANKMTSKLGEGVNGVIDGINWVLGKINVKEIPTWTVPQYKDGTKGHKGGPAILGDGGKQELFITPQGHMGISPATDTLMNLPKGTSVLSGNETERFLSSIPKYESGIGDFFSMLFDGPKKLISKVWDKFTPKFKNLTGLVGDVARGSVKYIKDKAFNFLKGKLDGFLKSDVGSPGGSGVERWRPVILRAAAMMGEKVTAAEVNGILAQIKRESGGNEKIIQSRAVWDINWQNNNPARGLLQYIPQTFRAYAVPGYNNIYNGFHQLLAFFNNRTWRRDLPYGRRGWGPRGGRKFATGGLINSEGLYQLGEEGPEWVIPTAPHRRTEAMKLLALAGKQIAGNKRPHQLPNVTGDNRNEEISLLKQQVQLLTELVLSNRQIANKPVLTEGDIGRAYDRYDSRQASKHAIFSGRGV